MLKDSLEVGLQVHDVALRVLLQLLPRLPGEIRFDHLVNLIGPIVKVNLNEPFAIFDEQQRYETKATN